GSPRAGYGTQAPRWGETPAPGPRVRARWDPEPALELAIRASEVAGGDRAGDPVEGGGGTGACPSRACMWGVWAKRGSPPVLGEAMGSGPPNSPARLPLAYPENRRSPLG